MWSVGRKMFGAIRESLPSLLSKDTGTTTADSDAVDPASESSEPTTSHMKRPAASLLESEFSKKPRTEADEDNATAAAAVGSHENEAAPGNLSDLFDAHLVGPGSLALQTTSVEDLLRVRQVYTACRDFLRPDNTNFWRDLAMKQFPSGVAAALSGLPKEERANVDFYRLSRGFGLKQPPEPKLPVPTLRIEDIIVVVDLYREMRIENGREEREKVGTFRCSDCSPWLQKDEIQLVSEGDPVILECLNPLSVRAESVADEVYAVKCFRRDWFDSVCSNDEYDGDYRDPVRYAAEQDLLIKTTLFRRDNWHSISLQETEDDSFESGTFDEASNYFFLGDTIPFASFARTGPGALSDQNIRLEFNLELNPILPELGSPDERNLHKQLRNRDLSDWTESDQDEIAAVDFFKFQISGLSASMECSTYHLRAQVDSDDDFVRVLEGFDWQ